MRRRAAAPGSAAAGRKEKFDETKIPIMKKALKIAGIALALLLAAALVVPMAFRGTLGEVKPMRGLPRGSTSARST